MRLLRAIWLWLQVVGGLVALIAIVWLGAQYAFHLKILNVQTGSMRPAFSPGDALILERSSTAKVGEVVSYHSARNPNELITHRVVWVGQGSFQTKGDRLATPDPAVRNTLLAGRVIAVLPGMGRALSWLQTWPGLVATVYLPAGAIVAQELIRLERTYRRRQIYRLPEAQVL